LAGLIGAFALLVGGADASAAETPATPEQAQRVAAALAGIDAPPHWMNIDGSVSLALSNEANKLAFTIGDEFRAIGDVEGPRRARWGMSESFACNDIPLILHAAGHICARPASGTSSGSPPPTPLPHASSSSRSRSWSGRRDSTR
jgi:hypothetical protein